MQEDGAFQASSPKTLRAGLCEDRPFFCDRR
jgi:hypothetical protein